MQGRLAFCIRASVLSLALFACSTGEPTSPEDPEDPEAPPIPSTVRWSDGPTWPGGQVPAAGAAVVIPSGKRLARREPAGAREPADRGRAGLRRAGPRAHRGSRPGAGHAPGRHQRGAVPAPRDHHPDRHARPTATSSAWATGAGRRRAARWTCTASRGRAGLGWPPPRRPARPSSSSRMRPTWRAGDKLVVASTDFDPNHAEVVTVASVSGTTVTLEQGARVQPLRRAADHRRAHGR